MASATNREVIEGVQHQGTDEVIAYTVDTSRIGVPSTPVVVVVRQESGGATGVDVTAIHMPINVPTVSGNVITLSPLKLLAAGQRYRVEVQYDIDGNTLESYFIVEGQI